MGEELDIVKILKLLRDTKILLSGTLMSEFETKFQVKHAPKNIINLDETSDPEDQEFEHSYTNASIA